MDVLAHGLWGGAAFSARGKKEFWTGFLVGMAPDLLSFGVFHVRLRPDWMRWPLGRVEISGPPCAFNFAVYVFHAYNVHLLLLAAGQFIDYLNASRPLFLP